MVSVLLSVTFACGLVIAVAHVWSSLAAGWGNFKQLSGVGEGGLEPPSPFGHMHLKHARLPDSATRPGHARIARRGYTNCWAYCCDNVRTICTYQSAWL